MKLKLLFARSTEAARRCVLPCALLYGLVSALPAPAELKIEVTEGVEGGVPIAVSPFRGEPEGLDRNYHRIVADDLAYSGLFLLIDAGVSESPLLGSDLDYGVWLIHGVEKVIIGAIAQDGQVHFELHDAVRGKRLKEFVIDSGGTVDRVAHQISDLIYKELTDIPGIFSTRIAFISAEHYSWRRHRSTLYVSDADGRNAHAIHSSPHQLMSPTWSPDRKRIAYVSYENGQPEIVVQTVATGAREMLGGGTAPASLPSWSGDGERLAYVSSAGGSPDVYVIELASKRILRVTDNVFIDTEPTWAPDGTLVFTSDRSGSPQLYRVDSDGAAPRRITFRGTYNSDASISPRGDQIAFLSRRSKGFVIVIKDFTGKDGDESELVFNPGAEGPRFTANGQLLGYITDRGGKSAFGLMTTDGVFGKLIPLSASDVRGAAWSPFTW